MAPSGPSSSSNLFKVGSLHSTHSEHDGYGSNSRTLRPSDSKVQSDSLHKFPLEQSGSSGLSGYGSDNVSTSSLLTLLSKTSSSSSIPTKIPTPASFSSTGPLLQLIDENQTFNHQLEGHLCDVLHMYPRGGISSTDYKVIAVFGVQSSGKSTLLNALFGTAFPVMRDDIRAQTTKGIWLSKAQGAPFLILDVEGTDGRERGENQDFERKAALFSLAIAQIVVINMWEYSVGLYNGANMVLLKTVLEVHCQLFQKQTESAVKTTLLFVIRDFIGTTPFSQLQNIIKNDLASIWSSISLKDSPSQKKDSLEDHFIIAFASLPHKILKPDEFNSQVKSLSERFYKTDSSTSLTFTPAKRSSDHIMVPLDGFATYAAAIWERIKTNKDLDLPTQQQLLAQFRCKELAQTVLDRLETALSSISMPSGGLHPSLGAALDTLFTSADAEFLGSAQRYHSATVERQREELLERIANAFRPIVSEQLRTACRRAVLLFVGGIESGIRAGSLKFAEIISSNKSAAMNFFDERANTIIPKSPGANIDWGMAECRNELIESISERTSFYKREELQKAITLVSESFQKALTRRLATLLDDASSGQLESRKKSSSTELSLEKGIKSFSGIWEALFVLYSRLVNDAQSAFSAKLAGILPTNGVGSEEMSEELAQKLNRSCWDHLLSRLKEDFNTTSLVLARLKRRFDNSFKYDSRGTPRLWAPGEDVNKPYNMAIEQTNLLLDDFAELVGIPIGSPFVPATQTTDRIQLMTPEQKALIRDSFLREAELAYIDATRSTLLQPRTHIPTWLIVLLIVLGWNELMAILSSPVYFLLAVSILIFLYVGGYIPMLGGVFPAVSGLTSLLITKAVEVTQNLNNVGEHNERWARQNVPSSKTSSFEPRESRGSSFDMHRPTFSKYQSPSNTFETMDIDHDSRFSSSSMEEERTSLLASSRH